LSTEDDETHPRRRHSANTAKISLGFALSGFGAVLGLAERRRVFLDGAGMPVQWTERRHMTVGEISFGAGLGLLALWDRWRHTAPAHARLNYLAVAPHPIQDVQAEAALAQYPELTALGRQLLAQWPTPRPGLHHMQLDGGRVRVTLFVGDMASMLAQAEARVDAWWLSGNFPLGNPALAHIARLSAPGALLTATPGAEALQRALRGAGFAVDAEPGPDAAAPILRGRFVGPAPTEPARPPWLAPPPPAPDGPILVVGGGLAGCSVAGALAARGRAVTLIERQPRLAAEASALPLGLVMPRPSAGEDGGAQFLAACFAYAARHVATLGSGWEPCGALHLAATTAEQTRVARWAKSALHPAGMLQPVDRTEASERAGIALPMGGMWLPQAGLAQPGMLCAQATAAVERICLRTPASALTRTDSGWRLHTEAGNFDAAAVVLAGANDAQLFAPAGPLPLHARRGQTSLLPPSSTSAALRVALTFGGYLTPMRNGAHHAGATFDPVPPSGELALRRRDHAYILAGLAEALPGLFSHQPQDVLGGHVGIRAVTTDRLPLAGVLPNLPDWANIYARLSVGERFDRLPPPSFWLGLAVHTGLGARGLTTAWLTAELIAAQLCGEPWPMTRDAADSVHPGRFLIRSLKRPARVPN
jgi:tRNA 5-methylaminomethyl-2-thiouridine biosynthesis bifunctional protein